MFFVLELKISNVYHNKLIFSEHFKKQKVNVEVEVQVSIGSIEIE